MNHPEQYVNNIVKKVAAAESLSLQCAQQIYYETKYQIGESIGNGSFGEVYKCARYNNSNDLVAIKVEHKSSAFRQLRLEYKVNTKPHLFLSRRTNFSFRSLFDSLK